MAGNKQLEAVVDFVGNIDPSLSKAIEGAKKQLGGINLKAVAAGAAVGGIAIATGKAVASAAGYLKDLGAEFDEAFDSIRVGTGATGEDLAALQDDFKAVYSSVPTTMEDASKAIADYNTRLGLTGENLQGISGQAIQVADLLGEDLGGVIEGSSKAFQQWNIDADGMGDAMDYVFKVSQSTGTGFTDLMDTVQQFGPQLQEMGYSFEEATALIGQLDKAGVNTSEVLAAMKKSVGTLAKEGISASDGLQMYYEKIQNAGTAAEAAAIANEVFGTRAGSTMASAIREGSLSVEDLTKSLQENGETIAGAAGDTYDYAESLQLFKQKAQVALEPLGSTIFSALSDMMPALSAGLDGLIPIINSTVEAAMPFVEDFLQGAVETLGQVMPLIMDLAASLLPILLDLVSTLLPPLLQLVQAVVPPLIQIVQAILPPIASLLTSILPIITQIASAVLPVLVNIISSLLPVITPLLDILMQILQQVVMPLLPPIMQLVNSLLPPIVTLINAIMPLLSPLLSILEPIANVLSTIVGWISKIISFGSGVISKIAGLFGGGGGGGGGGGFATGGFTSGPSIAGEDPRYPTEAVISFNPAYRAQNLEYWTRAGEMLGASTEAVDSQILLGGSNTSVTYDLTGLTFAPQVKVEGNADTDTLMRKLKDLEPEFVDFVLEALARREAGSYVTADSGVY